MYTIQSCTNVLKALAHIVVLHFVIGFFEKILLTPSVNFYQILKTTSNKIPTEKKSYQNQSLCHLPIK